jgi:hypothetical protein
MAQVGDTVWAYYGNFNGGFYCDVFIREEDAYAMAYRDMLDAATLTEILERKLRSGKGLNINLQPFLTYYPGEDQGELDVQAAFYHLDEPTRRRVFEQVLSLSSEFEVYIERVVIE